MEAGGGEIKKKGGRERERESPCFCFREGGFKLLIGEILRLVGSQQVRRVNNTIHWQMKMRSN